MNKPALWIALAALGLALSGCAEKTYDMPKQDVPETADTKFMKEMATKSGGDFNKLSPEEQKRADEISRGHGADAMKYYANPPK